MTSEIRGMNYSGILNKIKNTFEGIPLFESIPFEMTLWEQEYRQQLATNINMEVNLSLDIETHSPFDDFLTLNLTEYPLTLEGPLVDLAKEKKLINLEFYNAQDAMERLGEKVENQGGNTKISYGTNGQKVFIHYIVDFHSTNFSDGTSLGSTCRITFEIDNNTFVTPDVERVPVSNNDFHNIFGDISIKNSMQAVAIIGVTAIAIGIMVSGGAVLGQQLIYAFSLLATEYVQ